MQLISFAYSKNRKLWHNFVGGRSVYEEVMSLPCSLRFLPSIWRAYSTTGCDQPIICISPGSCVYAFGSASQSGTPLIQDFDWTVQDGEAWVVISLLAQVGKIPETFISCSKNNIIAMNTYFNNNFMVTNNHFTALEINIMTAYVYLGAWKI